MNIERTVCTHKWMWLLKFTFYFDVVSRLLTSLAYVKQRSSICPQIHCHPWCVAGNCGAIHAIFQSHTYCDARSIYFSHILSKSDE